MYLLASLFVGVLSATGFEGKQTAPPIEDVIAHIQESERGLDNIQITAKYSSKRWNRSSEKWEDGGDAKFTAWLDGLPKSKMKIDFDRRRTVWTNGAAPFHEDSVVLAYNGRTGQTRTSTLRGTVTADRPNMGVARFGSGWSVSLYGAGERKGLRFSEMLRGMIEDANTTVSLAQTSFDGLPVLQVIAVEGQGTITYEWNLDPKRNYAVLRCKRKEGSMCSEIVIEELIQVAPSVYYPTKGIYNMVVCSNGDPVAQNSYQVLEIAANTPDLSDEVFNIQFPAGTVIYDEILGNSYEIVPDLEELSKGGPQLFMTSESFAERLQHSQKN